MTEDARSAGCVNGKAMKVGPAFDEIMMFGVGGLGSAGVDEILYGM